MFSIASLAVATAAIGAAAGPAGAATSTVVPFQATGWKYQETNTVDPSFAQPGFDDSGWATGQAAFGTTGGCSFNTAVNTVWATDSYELIRHHFTVPVGTTSIHIDGTIDNNAVVYVNGVDYQDVASGSCASGAISVDVPASALTNDNVIAVAAQNTGGPDFIDVEVTATGDTAGAVRATVTGVSPSTGPLSGGQAVVITGAGFTYATRVVFGRSRATQFTVVSDSEIDAISPAATEPDVVHVRVHTQSADEVSAGLSARSPANRYRYVAAT